jgi:LysM domain
MTASLDMFLAASPRDVRRPAPPRPSGAASARPGRVAAGPGRRRLGRASSCLGVGAVSPLGQVSGRTPLRLTRRGQAAAMLAGIVGGCIVGIAAWMSAPEVAPAGRPSPSAMVVREGDTLWSIASRVAPGSDPRQEVAHLLRVNGLTDVTVLPGQTLRVR